MEGTLGERVADPPPMTVQPPRRRGASPYPRLLGIALVAGGLAQLVASAVVPSSATGARGARLEAGHPVAREIGKGETHVYEVVVPEGRVVNGVVDQRGVDVVVRVVDPAGATVATVDSPNGPTGPEPWSLSGKPGYLALIGGPVNGEEAPLLRFEDTDLFYLTLRVPKDARFTYMFRAGDPPNAGATRKEREARFALSQSGSFWFTPGALKEDAPDDLEPGEMMREIVAAPRQPVRFWMEVGRFEGGGGLNGSSQLAQNRHLRDVLRAKGYDVSYREFSGGHDYACWRGSLADGLVALAGGGPRPVRP
jgi:hypothetical protein